MTSFLRSTVAAMLLCTMAACGGGAPHPKTVTAPPSNSADVRTAFDLMMNGDEATARKLLKTVVKRDANNAEAQLLIASMRSDPVELLGPRSYGYNVRSGDTIAELAQRLLGNRLKAYQLLRYNKLKAPVALAAGQALRIPGEPPRIETPRAEPARRADPTPQRPAAAAPKLKPTKPNPPASALPSKNPAVARQARAAGLVALNQGGVVKAIALLRRAAALDPGNPLITRDLARAERIAATVRAKH